MNSFLEKNFDEIVRASFLLSPQAIYWLNKDGKLLFANDNALNRLDYTLEELQNLNLWDVDVTVDTKEKYLQALDSFEKGQILESNVIQTYHRKKNNETFPVEVVSRFHKIDSEEYIVSYAKDITNRVQRTEKINLYFELINSSKDMIFLVDLETERIEFANDIVCESLGFSFKELNKMKVSDIRKPVEGEKKIKISEVFDKLKESKNLITQGIYITKDGKEIPVETSVHLKNYLGRSFVIAISRDISERIEIEKKQIDLNKKLKEYNQNLEEEVRKFQKELIDYEDIMKKQSKMAAMGEMIENIAHQWRQPLSAVSVLSSGMMLQNQENILDKETLTSNLNKIHEQVQYLSKTIDDFRNFFKPDKEKNSFKVKDLIKNSIKLIKSRYNNIPILFIEDIEDNELFTYENELLQVILNIINNSVDELINKECKRLIFINSYKKHNYLIIKIKDNGGGIDEKIIDRIFEPYFTTKHNYQGTGIGLYMSNNIIRHLHGKIEVKNIITKHDDIVYKGASFKIKLPLSFTKDKYE